MPAPPLPDELIELALVASLRTLTCNLTSTDLAPLLPYLTAGPRTLAPAVTKAALNDLPWIDLDFASRVGDTALMDLMVELEKRRNGRPLQWTHRALTEAAANGHVHVLDWWRKQKHLQVEWVSLLTPALRGGHVNVLEWWSQSGLKMYFTQPLMPLAMTGATVPGTKACVLWAHAHRPRLIFEENEEESSQRAQVLVQRLITHSYCPQVYEWARAAGEYTLDAHAILTAALRWGATDALDWVVGDGKLISHAQMREGMGKIVADALPAQIKMRNAPAPAEDKPVKSGYCKKSLPDAISMCHDIHKLRWFVDSAAGVMMLDIAGFDAFKRLILVVARTGGVDVLRQIEAMGRMSVSNGVLVAALESGHVETVEYVLGRMAAGAVDQCACKKCGRDPFKVLTWQGAKVGSVVALLGTLVAHGILPNPELAQEYLLAAIDSQRMPLVTWWMQQPDCAKLLASDPAVFPTLFTDFALSRVCQEGNAEFLEWWMRQPNVDLDELLEPNLVFMAASMGHLDVLKMLYARVPHLVREFAKYPVTEYTIPRFQFHAMYAAADANEQDAGTLTREVRMTLIDALSSCASVKSPEDAVRVLDWWVHSARLPMYYTTYAMDSASRVGLFPVLDWWLAHKAQLELKYSPAALNTNCNSNRYRKGNAGAFRLDTRVLHWWYKSGLRTGFDGVWLHEYMCDHADPHAKVDTAGECYLCGNSAANLPLLIECTEASQMHLDRVFQFGMEVTLKPPVGRLLLRMGLRHYRPDWMDEDVMDASGFVERLRELFGELWDGHDAGPAHGREVKYLTAKRDGGLPGAGGMQFQVMQAMMGAPVEDLPGVE